MIAFAQTSGGAAVQTTWSGRDPVRGEWRVERAGGGFVLRVEDRDYGVAAAEAATAIRVAIWPRATVTMGDLAGAPRLRGLSRRQARTLRTTLRVASALAPAVECAHRLRSLVEDHEARQVFIPHDAVALALAARPTPPRIGGRRVRARDRRWRSHLAETEAAALELLERDVDAWVRDTNERIVARELEQRREFLDSIEKSPLTAEQARAVVTFDNRVRVIAAAGSGKTSVMVARAAYALERGLVAPRADLAPRVQHGRGQ